MTYEMTDGSFGENSLEAIAIIHATIQNSKYTQLHVKGTITSDVQKTQYEGFGRVANTV